MPHNNVVQMLKDCPFNSAAIFVIQRGPILMGGDAPFAPRVNLGPGTIPDPYGYPLNGQAAYLNRMKVSKLVCFSYLFRQLIELQSYCKTINFMPR